MAMAFACEWNIYTRFQAPSWTAKAFQDSTSSHCRIKDNGLDKLGIPESLDCWKTFCAIVNTTAQFLSIAGNHSDGRI